MKTHLSIPICFTVLMVLAMGLAASCGGDDTAAGAEAEKCEMNTQCNTPLVCAFQRCRRECDEMRDCPVPLRCVQSIDVGTGRNLGKVCQVADEVKDCTVNSDCPGLQICGIDAKCRDMCLQDKDCPLLTYKCVNRTCAAPDDLNPMGGLNNKNDAAVTRDGEAITPTDDGGSTSTTATTMATTSTGMGGAGGAGGGQDAGTDVSMGGSGGSSGVDASMDVSQPPYDGPCGHTGEPCCTTGSACTLGYACNASRMCVTCGAKGQPCCGTSCVDNNLECIANTCQCGDSNQICCGGTMCNSGLTCSMSDAGIKPTCACGGNAQACCPGMMCNGTSLYCAGLKCTCITACSGDRTNGSEINVLRKDGSVWFYNGYSTVPVSIKDAAAGVVTGFTKVQTSQGYSCGIKSDKTVWCWLNPINNATMTSYGELGDGTNVGSKAPVQVVTGLGGPALANVTTVSSFGATTCAVSDAGTPASTDDTVWCWGYNAYGQLGNATTSQYSNFAVKVVLSLGGEALLNVDQLSLGSNYACAHQRSDAGGEGSAWCWGYNGYGQLGTGDKMASSVPKKIAQLLDGVSQVASSNYMTCARTGPDVWCWGYGGSFGVGDGILGEKLTPVRVLAAAGGAPFTGALDLKSSSAGPCVLKSGDNSVWCWFSNTAHPAPVSPAGFMLSSVAYWDNYGSNYTCFARTDGELYIHAYKPTYPVACQ